MPAAAAPFPKLTPGCSHNRAAAAWHTACVKASGVRRHRRQSFAPVSPGLPNLTGALLNVNGKPNGLREAVVDFFGESRGEWEVRVQLCTDLETMPVEDASATWPEDQSSYVAVARINVQPQSAWSEIRVTNLDDGLSFIPWHGLAAHQPLGSIMRARKPVYESSTQFRQEFNQHAIEEPRNTSALPDQASAGAGEPIAIMTRK